jgi:hypothetical protein
MRRTSFFTQSAGFFKTIVEEILMPAVVLKNRIRLLFVKIPSVYPADPALPLRRYEPFPVV